MRFRMVPTDDKFFDYFRAQADTIALAADLLSNLAAYPDGDLQETYDGIAAAERRGDDIVRDVHARLASSFVTPFDREDIHLITERLDDVLDDVYHVAALLHVIAIGDAMPEMNELCRILCDMSKLSQAVFEKFEAMKGLDDLLSEIGSLESEADRVYRRAIAQLYNGSDPMNVLRWKDVLEGTEHAIDRLEDVSDVIEAVVVKHA